MLDAIGSRQAVRGECQGEGGFHQVAGTSFWVEFTVLMSVVSSRYPVLFCTECVRLVFHLQFRHRVAAVRYSIQSGGRPLGLYTGGHGWEQDIAWRATTFTCVINCDAGDVPLLYAPPPALHFV